MADRQEADITSYITLIPPPLQHGTPESHSASCCPKRAASYKADGLAGTTTAHGTRAQLALQKVCKQQPPCGCIASCSPMWLHTKQGVLRCPESSSRCRAASDSPCFGAGLGSS